MSSLINSQEINGRTIHISNLHQDVTEDILRELFTQVGPILIISKIKVKKPRYSSGTANEHEHRYAFIEFKHKESVPFAIDLMNAVKLFGWPIMVHESKPSRRAPVNERTEEENRMRHSWPIENVHITPYWSLPLADVPSFSTPQVPSYSRPQTWQLGMMFQPNVYMHAPVDWPRQNAPVNQYWNYPNVHAGFHSLPRFRMHDIPPPPVREMLRAVRRIPEGPDQPTYPTPANPLLTEIARENLLLELIPSANNSSTTLCQSRKRPADVVTLNGDSDDEQSERKHRRETFEPESKSSSYSNLGPSKSRTRRWQ